MRKQLLFILISLLLLFAFVSCQQNPVAVDPSGATESGSATIKGMLDLPESDTVSGSDVWIKIVSNGETRNISQAKADGSFSVSGLRADEKYDILFTTNKPSSVNEKEISRGEKGTSGYGGWLSNVTATVGEGTDIGSVTISPLGTIKGKVTLDGETEHLDILVYIPGTSFSGYASAEGDFEIYDVPEGNYTLRYMYLKTGFGSETLEGVAVRGSKTDKEEHPVTQLDDVVLYRDLGVVEGKALLDSDNDSSGIAVMIKKDDGSKTYSSNTDSAGSYHIDDVKPGKYTLYISKSGFDTIVIENLEVAPAATKMVPVQTLSSGVRYATGKVQLEGKTDHSGALITATNTTDTTLIYSAISNSEGDYSLVNMKPGEYRIVVTSNNYNTETLGVKSILKDAVVNLGQTDMTIIRGTILGTATLEGRGSSAGIKAELMKGTDVYATTTTDDSGLYAFSVPQGNYSGVRLSCEDFRSVSIAQSIALIANDYVTIGEESGATAMIATHVPVMKGRLTVKGLLSLDYSGIKVTLSENGMTTTTDKDGYWSFSKVPVGSYTLKFERENTNTVTKAIDVVAAAEKNVEAIELVPNAASIEGHVALDGLTDHSGITVRATAPGMAELSTKTNAAGYFYLGNVVTTETYTVYFEKDGWVSQSRQVSGLEDLSLNDITDESPVTLVDTTTPVLNSIAVVVGNSEQEGRKLNVYFNAVETGSGLSKVYINTSSDFTGVEPQNYSDPFACYVPDTEGDFTLYAKVVDASGNESETVSQSFRIADYKTTVSSVLIDNEDGKNDGIITWTKAKSPYYVTGNILVDEDTTLIIEPGVNVQFSGDYYIQVEGKLEINGTENDKVYLYGVGAGENKWTGIKGSKSRGSIINNASITGMVGGLQGYLVIKDSQVKASGSRNALNEFHGTIENSSIEGGVYANGASFLSDELIINSGKIIGSLLSGTTMRGDRLEISESTLDNNAITSMNLELYNNSAVCSTLSKCTLTRSSGMIYKCELDECAFSSFSSGTIKDSNIVDSGILTIKTQKSNVDQVALKGNYWGINNTAELIANGVNSNLSFIVDYYDDFNVTKADLSGYRTEVISDAGYSGIKTGPAQYSIGDTGPAGGIVFYDKGYYSDGWRYLEAAPSDFGNGGHFIFGYYKKTNDGINLRSGTACGIGFGKFNTQILVDDMGDAAYATSDGTTKTESYAAKLCDTYSYGGYDDWFLPSRDELNLMYVNLYKAGFGGFEKYYYLSSSESNDSSQMWEQNFGSGHKLDYVRDGVGLIRPIRAF